jgi:hypothetical protein
MEENKRLGLYSIARGRKAEGGLQSGPRKAGAISRWRDVRQILGEMMNGLLSSKTRPPIHAMSCRA